MGFDELMGAANKENEKIKEAGKKKKINKIKAKTSPEVKEKKSEEKSESKKTEEANINSSINSKTEYEIPEDTSSKKVEERRSRGRPKNEYYGKIVRKQYTITLPEELYQKIMRIAQEKDTSFSKYSEKAILEYIKNHE